MTHDEAEKIHKELKELWDTDDIDKLNDGDKDALKNVQRQMSKNN